MGWLFVCTSHALPKGREKSGVRLLFLLPDLVRELVVVECREEIAVDSGWVEVVRGCLGAADMVEWDLDKFLSKFTIPLLSRSVVNVVSAVANTLRKVTNQQWRIQDYLYYTKRLNIQVTDEQS